MNENKIHYFLGMIGGAALMLLVQSLDKKKPMNRWQRFLEVFK